MDSRLPLTLDFGNETRGYPCLLWVLTWGSIQLSSWEKQLIFGFWWNCKECVNKTSPTGTGIQLKGGVNISRKNPMQMVLCGLSVEGSCWLKNRHYLFKMYNHLASRVKGSFPNTMRAVEKPTSLSKMTTEALGKGDEQTFLEPSWKGFLWGHSYHITMWLIFQGLSLYLRKIMTNHWGRERLDRPECQFIALSKIPPGRGLFSSPKLGSLALIHTSFFSLHPVVSSSGMQSSLEIS